MTIWRFLNLVVFKNINLKIGPSIFLNRESTFKYGEENKLGNLN